MPGFTCEVHVDGGHADMLRCGSLDATLVELFDLGEQLEPSGALA